MRRALCVLSLILACSAVAGPARARGGRGDWGGNDRYRHHQFSDTTSSDSARRPPWHVTGELGVGWMQAPANVRARYRAGMDASGALELRGRAPVALSFRLEYHDLPNASSENAPIYTGSGALPYDNLYPSNNGRAYDVGIYPLLRMRRDLWADFGGGFGYFDSGYGSGATYVDGVTLQVLPLPAGSGWGPVYGAGLRYEFQPTPRDRLYAAFRWFGMNRGGTSITCLRLAVGYQFL